MISEIIRRLEEDEEFGKDILRASKIDSTPSEGIDMDIGGWFNGTTFCKPVLPSFRYNRLMVGDVGPVVEEMGIVMGYRKHNKLFNETLLKLVPFLKTTGYHGFINLHCIVNQEKAHALSWSSELSPHICKVHDFAYPNSAWNQFFLDLDMGKTPDVPAATNLWVVGIVTHELQPVARIKYKPLYRFVPTDVYVGWDINLQVAQTRAYNKIDQEDDTLLYRTDIGTSVIENLPILKSWGWMK